LKTIKPLQAAGLQVMTVSHTQMCCQFQPSAFGPHRLPHLVIEQTGVLLQAANGVISRKSLLWQQKKIIQLQAMRPGTNMESFQHKLLCHGEAA
jgi:hypothetical protein